MIGNKPPTAACAAAEDSERAFRLISARQSRLDRAESRSGRATLRVSLVSEPSRAPPQSPWRAHTYSRYYRREAFRNSVIKSSARTPARDRAGVKLDW